MHKHFVFGSVCGWQWHLVPHRWQDPKRPCSNSGGADGLRADSPITVRTSLTSITRNKWSSCLRGPHTRSGRGFSRNDSSIWSLETSLIVIAFYRWDPDNGAAIALYDWRCQKTHFARQRSTRPARSCNAPSQPANSLLAASGVDELAP